MLLGLLIGQINLYYVLHKIRRENNPSCWRFGAEKETLEHILHDCLVLEEIRMQTLVFVRMDSNRMKDLKLSSIVAFGKRAGLLNSPP